MPAGSRLRLGVASLLASANQGVDEHLVGAAWRRASGLTLGISVARAGVGGLIRTDTDPQSNGLITYNSTLISGTLARRVMPRLTVGVAARYREGRTDLTIRSAIAADLGLVFDSLSRRQIRIGVSSFLWRPGRERDDQPVFLAAVDGRIFTNPERPDVRIGIGRNASGGGGRELVPFTSVRTGLLEARAGLVITSGFGNRDVRARSGLALHFPRYVVGIGREEGIGGLGPLYQFTLSSLVK